MSEQKTESQRPVVAAFDFDVTITTQDTFVPFLMRTFGKWPTYKAFILLGVSGLLVLCKLYSRDRFKEKIVHRLFAGQSVAALIQVGVNHAQAIKNLARPEALERIAWHKARGDRLIMVSASLDLYLEPVAKALGFDDLLCTRLVREGLVFTGELDGKNCRAQEKVNKLTSLLGDLTKVELYAYGDSAGDKEMLEVADHPFMRAFEPGGSLTKL